MGTGEFTAADLVTNDKSTIRYVNFWIYNANIIQGTVDAIDAFLDI